MKVRTGQPLPVLLAAILVLLSFSLACGLAGSGQKQVNPTLTALSASIAGTATAEAAKGDDTVIKLQTAQANSTATSQVVKITQTSRASTRNETQVVKATVAAPILAELPFYNVDTNQGHVGWIGDTETISVTGYQQTQFSAIPVTAADFVLASDLTWDTQYGSSGCGFMFRSDGDRNKPSAYLVMATRFASGHMIFTALDKGDLANLHDFFPKDNDKSFKADNGATNRIAIVGRGNLIEIYSNQAKIGEIDTTKAPTPMNMPSAPVEPTNKKDKAAMDKYLKQVDEYQDIIKQMQSQYSLALTNFQNKPAIFTDGFLGLMALSESGRTQCKFDNSWLWIIDK
jgi:hypothetical protein